MSPVKSINDRWAKPTLPSIMSGVFVLAVLGMLLGIGAAFDWNVVHLQAAQWANAWWLVPVLIVGQALPFAFALPGSLMFFVIGLLYDPLPATAMIAAGGVLGSMAAYWLSWRLADSWVRRVQHQRLFQLLQRNSNFLMLSAMRTFPGFPHSVINYGSGLLHVPWKRFIFSAAVGYLIKGLLYTSILHSVVDADEAADLFTLEVLWPLVVLAVLFVAGFGLQKWFGVSKARNSS
ncbi:TVP38/TMEM64 family protein [Desulfonatronum thioautotrophicum]|uniref:TVP38/TMEM64 family protein n=1 Tax=Desulfonatronum thioautotrophicum TaxID=617001 RepID=UPI00069C3539|nr:VTT domain-containing protein [Desulfonatronum thioautotrophicum]